MGNYVCVRVRVRAVTRGMVGSGDEKIITHF
jgi:hypothetical protein